MTSTQDTADFFTLTISNLTPQEAELAAALAFDAGAEGTAEELAFEQKSRVYEPVTLEKERTQLAIYFSKAPQQFFLESMAAQFPDAKVSISAEKNKDWLEEWKKGFQPFALCGKTWVVPTWCERPSEAQSVIGMDPGMAFGTGTHETTRLAAGFISDFAPESLRDHLGAELYDIGTGTGILAILAEQLGFSKVIGNDIDVEARRVARENIELNKCRRTSIVDLPLEKIEGQAHWVVANIIDGVLVQLREGLVARVRPGGYLLLTGILDERDELFRSEFSFEGFELCERRELGEWVGYLLHKIDSTEN